MVEPPARPLVEGKPARVARDAAPPARALPAGPARAAVRELRAERYDVGARLPGPLEVGRLGARCPARGAVVGYARRWRREPLLARCCSRREAPPPGVHVIDKNLALLRAVGIEAVGSREFPLPPTRREAAASTARLARARASRRATFVVLNPGGGWESKLWPRRALRRGGARPARARAARRS